MSGNTGAPGSGSIGAHVGGPVLRARTLEDIYDGEAGNKIQAALRLPRVRGSDSNPAEQSYGAAIDDVTIEWKESHPIQQVAGAGCGGNCSGGSRAGKLCFNTDDCGVGGSCSGATVAAQASCAAISWGTNSLFNGSGVVALNLVDFNAETTQGASTARATASPPAAAGATAARATTATTTG